MREIKETPTIVSKPQQNVAIDIQDIISALSNKLAKAEADNAIKDATNMALTRRIAELENIRRG